MLDSIQNSFSSAFSKLRGKGKLTQKDIDTVLLDIKNALIESDVALEVAEEFLEDIRAKSSEIEYSKTINPSQQIVKVIAGELEKILGKDVERPLNRAKSSPTVYMLVGLQGAGKTTLAGKLGFHLKKNGHTPLLVAADLQRPGAVKQLEIVGEKAGVPVFSPNAGTGVDGELIQKSGLKGLFGGRDVSKEAITVAKDAVSFAKQKLYDTIIIDTAGRLGVDEELMKQASDIKAAVNPDEVLFVLDSTTGQDAINSVTAFNQGLGITGSILTKFDSDSKGGAALSVAKITNQPILFAGVGEKFEDLEVFHPDRIASRILDQGDILTLLEQAESKLDEELAQKTAEKLIEGEDFDLNDFLSQISMMKNMGSIKDMLTKLPGMNQHKAQIENFDEKQIDRVEAIIKSMTPFERANPKKLDGSRKARIARGSGQEVSTINQMLTQFTQMQKMMKQMMGKKGGMKKLLQSSNSDELDVDGLGGLGGFDGLNLGGLGQNYAGGMPGFGGGLPNVRGGVNKRKANNKKKKGKSGNPAVRAQQEAALRAKFQA